VVAVSLWLELMTDIGCDVIGVDHQTSLTDARKRLNNKIAIQGNMNPELLLQSPEKIQAEVARILAEYGHGSGHIFNLGHGITPDVPPENVAVLVEAVHELGKKYHS
jgi:uroporphyrinogen decarboxylase